MPVQSNPLKKVGDDMATMRRVTGIAMAFALCAGAPALAGVKEGVDAWDRGDYAGAVAQWQAAAANGDGDALYNLAQAYRLGRGVTQDAAKAEDLYARSAAAGHPLAADSYGVLLFQKGKRAEAVPYLRTAAGRGDPRAQYLLGISHFNGDFVEKDWPRAYALVTLANGQGLPQAREAISQMDQFIPLAQRQQGATMAPQMQAEAQATRARQLAAADLDGGISRSVSERAAPAGSKGTAPKAGTPPVTPADIVAATQARGTESPATAGADYARPEGAAKSVQQRPVSPGPVSQAVSPRVVPTQAPAPARQPLAATIERKAERARAASPAGDGPWRLQLGAFSVPGNADQLWRNLDGHRVLAGKRKYLQSSGRLTLLLAGGYASEAHASAACGALRKGGQSCLVTR